jgi:hypothetical protein
MVILIIGILVGLPIGNYMLERWDYEVGNNE